jgi:hypothetical protein
MYMLNHDIPEEKRAKYQELLTNLKEMRSLEQQKVAVLSKMICALENQLNTPIKEK